MNVLKNNHGVKAAILGTLVADASGMGVHWIYSQGKIKQIVQNAGDTAEFLEPDPENYQGVPAFFAHPHRHAGDGSNYSEYIYVLLQAVSEAGFDRATYIRVFQEYFGPGGEYVGYADGPMRETVYNITRLGKEIQQRVLDAETTLPPERLSSAAHYISRYYFEFDREGLKEQVRTPLKLQQWSTQELSEADRLIDAVSGELSGLGPDDDQMPALSRSAVLAHFYEGDELDRMVEQAVRITNNNDAAVVYSQFLAHVMRDLYVQGAGENPAATLYELAVKRLPLLGEKAQQLVRQALDWEGLDIRGATKTFGAACHVDMSVPLVLHILVNTATFREANRMNILASGDNCGRAIMLGPLAGGMYGIGGDRGIPEEWIWRTTMVERIHQTTGGVLLTG